MSDKGRTSLDAPARETRILTGDEVSDLLAMHECIEAVEDAFRRWALGDVPAPQVLGFHVHGGGFHIKAAMLARGGTTYFAAKTNANFPGNPSRHGLPSIQGLLAVFDATDGRPLALMDSIRITELRTAAATAVAARYLARADASRVTLVGCGSQAIHQLRALASVRHLTHIRLLDRDAEAARRLAALVAEESDALIEVTGDLDRALGASDICVTCTTARAPILTQDMMRAGLFVAGVGADNPEKHELAPDLLAGSTVVVDSLDQAAVIGDLHHALVADVMRREDVHAELGDVVAGLVPGRTSDDEVIVFDSTGTALQDVASAAIVYERAAALDGGRAISFAPTG